MIVNHFRLVSEDGTIYWAIEARAMNRVCSFGDDGFVVGLPEYRLDDGRVLKKGGDDLFTIIQTGEPLTRQPEESQTEATDTTERNLCKRPWGKSIPD